MFGQAIKAVVFKPSMTVRPATGPSQLARITGVVVDANGTPVAGATFTVDGVLMTTGGPATPRNPAGPVPYVTDVSGSFLIGRNAGKHTVQIDVPGYPATVLPDVEFVVGATVDLGPIPFGAGEVKSTGVSSGWWKWALGIGGGVLAVGLISFVGWKVYKKRKAPAVSEYMCRDCAYVDIDRGP